MERDSYWLLGRVWAPIPSRVGDSRQAGREPEAIRRIPGAVIRYSRASRSASYRAPASTTEEVPAGIYPQVLWLSGSGSTTRFSSWVGFAVADAPGRRDGHQPGC
jgi:hypothetical protein